MDLTKEKGAFFSGNALKIIACVSMLIDHIGVIFLPSNVLLRIIGRLAFPIFSFMIAEGARYTRSRLRYFCTLFGMTLVMLAAYYFYEGRIYASVLGTFSLSVLIIWVLDALKREIFRTVRSGARIFISSFVFLLSVALAWFVCRAVHVDYGFAGVMLPVITSFFMLPSGAPESARRFDAIPIHVGMCGVGIFLLSGFGTGINAYGMLALPLLLLYSGKRGRLKMKYFFYIFYPLHLVLLEGISLLLNMLKQV